MKKITFCTLFTFSLITQFNCQTEHALLEKVKVDLNNGNNPEVLLICSKILNNNNNNEVARLYKAESLMNIMQFDSSLKEIEKVIKLNSKNAKAYNLKGKVKLKLYDFKIKSDCDDAKQNFDIALQLIPNDFTVINNIAYYFQYCIGDIKIAKEQYDKSIAINENQPDIFYTRGSLKNELHDTIGAISDFTSAIKLNPNKMWYYILRARAYKNKKEYIKSLEDLNKALQIGDYDLADAFYERGEIAFLLNNYKLAIEDFTKIIENAKEASLANNIVASTYMLQGAYYNRGYAYYYENKNSVACEDWRNAFNLKAKGTEELITKYCNLDPIIYLNRGRTKYDEEDYNGALEMLNKYLDTKPNSEEAIITRGHCKYMLKNYLGAIDDYNICLKSNLKNIDAIFYRGSAYYELGNYKEAIINYNSCININPKYTEAYYYRGKCYDNLKDYKNALLDYNKVIEINSKMFESEIYFNRAVVKSSLSDSKGAINDYKKALVYDPKNAAIYLNSGVLKFLLKDYNGSLSDFNSALNIEPSFGMVYYYRGLTYLELHNNKNACEDLKIANDAGVELAGIKLTEMCK